MTEPYIAFNKFIVDEFNRPVDGASIYLTDINMDAALLWSDMTAPDIIENPYFTSDGRIEFYIDSGSYFAELSFGSQNGYCIVDVPVRLSGGIATYNNKIYDFDGDEISGASLAVYDPDLGAPAVIYTPSSGGVGVIANPTLSNAGGEVAFDVARGKYHLLATKSGYSSVSFPSELMPGVTVQQINFICAPLTYDEFLSDDVTSLVSNTSAPYITDLGMACNGMDSRLTIAALPAWSGGSNNIYMQASITPFLPTRSTEFGRDVIVSVGSTAPKVQLSVLRDPVNSEWLCVGFRGRNNVGSDISAPYVRSDWRFEGRYPQLLDGAYKARPQAICFNISDNGYTCLAHYQDTNCIFHVIDASGALVGQYASGVSSHYSTLARDQSGRLWTLDYATGMLYRINEAASIATGVLSADFTYNLSIIAGVGCIEFITYSTTNYILAVQYLTSGTPYLYAIAVSSMVNGGTFAIASRFKRFAIQRRCQGLAVQNFTDSVLYLSSNRINAESIDSGRVYTINIAAAMAGADGSTPAIVSLFQAASSLPEDIDFDSTGRLWTLTEGQQSVGDLDGFLSLWSTKFLPQENHYAVFYDGSSITFNVNNKLFQQFNFTSGFSGSAQLQIGGPNPIVDTPGWATGYFSGLIKNIFISDNRVNDALYSHIINGYFEPKSLTVVPLTIVNPGAESGTTGWINQVGSIATRALDPLPFHGAAYFAGGANAQTISHQSVNILSASGLTQVELDSHAHWVNVKWQQASYGGTDTDSASMGIAAMSGASELSRGYGVMINLPSSQKWFVRSFSKTMDAGADAAKIIYRSDRSAGTNNDGYIDSISAVLYIQDDD